MTTVPTRTYQGVVITERMADTLRACSLDDFVALDAKPHTLKALQRHDYLVGSTLTGETLYKLTARGKRARAHFDSPRPICDELCSTCRAQPKYRSSYCKACYAEYHRGYYQHRGNPKRRNLCVVCRQRARHNDGGVKRPYCVKCYLERQQRRAERYPLVLATDGKPCVRCGIAARHVTAGGFRLSYCKKCNADRMNVHNALKKGRGVYVR